MNLRKKHWLWISFAVMVWATEMICLASTAYRSARAWNDQASKEMMQSKAVYTSEATVLRREVFLCDKKICSFVDGYGDEEEIKQGETQGRVYYQIDNFDNLGEPRRSIATQAETERVRRSGTRFTIAGGDWYDRMEPGKKIYIHYRCFSDGALQIWGVDFDPR